MFNGKDFLMIMQNRLLLYLITGIFMVAFIILCIVCKEASSASDQEVSAITIFLCGDVMTGRGIDQVLPHPSSPVLYESYVKSAKGYVDIAERVNGHIPYPVSYSYIWGDALEEWDRMQPDVRIINLETSITKSGDYWKYKGINYRMHPENVACLTAAEIDFCSLANNHVLDWGYEGLRETIKTLKNEDIHFAGAGMSLQEAEMPVILDIEGKGRVIIFSYGSVTSGIPANWSAKADRAGVNMLKDLSDKTVQHIGERVLEFKEKGDIVLISIHWGSNWGYEIPPDQIDFAHKLIDEAGVDILHAHSSHHVKGIEIYKGKPILYGCGDFVNDYEGIRSHEEYRNDLSLMYFVCMDPGSGKLISLRMIPTQIRKFKVNLAKRADVKWLLDVLNMECKRFGSRIELQEDNSFQLSLF